MKRRPVISRFGISAALVSLALAALTATIARAQATMPAPAPETLPVDDRTLTIAVVDFDAKTLANPELGKQVAQVLEAALSGEPGFVLVDRGLLERTVREHELALSGVVDSGQAVKVGKLLNARVLVTGAVFPVDDKVWLVGKMIGTESSRMEAVTV